MRYESSTGKIVDGFPHRFKANAFTLLEQLVDERHVVPLRDLARGVAPTDSIAMRHDVDHNLDHALKFARWEAARGWRSTYFVLHTAWYYDRSGLLANGFESKLLELRELGHEVGLHANYIAELDNGADPNFERCAVRLTDELQYLRSVCHHIDVTGLGTANPEMVDGEHLEIVGVAAHGDPRAHTYGISNLDIWRAAGGPHEPADFGLEYEAYHLNAGRRYISDSGGHWNEPEPLTPIDHPTVMLIHPCHWDIDAALETDEPSRRS